MTAEIAILNKAAVALAADSAVTISAGTKEEKIFNTADKLFELSGLNPIGIMIYNGMSFMEVPLPSVVREFRNECFRVSRVEEAVTAFLMFLNERGRNAPDAVKDRNIERIATGVVDQISRYFNNEFEKRLFATDQAPENVNELATSILDEAIEIHEAVFKNAKDASFVGEGGISVGRLRLAQIGNIVQRRLPMASEAQRKRVIAILKLALRKNILSNGRTGIVIAGFGSGELFPTLISFETDGIVCDRLKYIRTNVVGIDRRGPKAKVLPFAQREMVERFIYGLDDVSQRQITRFCMDTLPDIRKQVLESVEVDDTAARKVLEDSIVSAEQAFLKGLRAEAFEKIRSRSRAEIEDMVEFMPKPELAQMAEALVELTSIKRRVSRGMETVGGPIDVALISQSEGFVWIKRKHYFPAELNARYFERMRSNVFHQLEEANGQDAKSRSASSNRKGKAAPGSERGGDDGGSQGSRRGHQDRNPEGV